MASVKYIIDNLFKSLASASDDEDAEAVALSGDIMNHPSGRKHADPRGEEYGFFEVTNISGGRRVTWYVGPDYVGDDAPVHCYTCYVPNEDWDIFQSEHGILDS